jgi:Ca2+/H+ antiporter
MSSPFRMFPPTELRLCKRQLAILRAISATMYRALLLLLLVLAESITMLLPFSCLIVAEEVTVSMCGGTWLVGRSLLKDHQVVLGVVSALFYILSMVTPVRWHRHIHRSDKHQEIDGLFP